MSAIYVISKHRTHAEWALWGWFDRLKKPTHIYCAADRKPIYKAFAGRLENCVHAHSAQTIGSAVWGFGVMDGTTQHTGVQPTPIPRITRGLLRQPLAALALVLRGVKWGVSCIYLIAIASVTRYIPERFNDNTNIDQHFTMHIVPVNLINCALPAACISIKLWSVHKHISRCD